MELSRSDYLPQLPQRTDNRGANNLGPSRLFPSANEVEQRDTKEDHAQEGLVAQTPVAVSQQCNRTHIRPSIHRMDGM